MAAEVEIANLVANIVVKAGGAEAAVKAFTQSLKDLEDTNRGMSEVTKKAMQDATTAYKTTSLSAQDAARRTKNASDIEKKALIDGAQTAQRAADEKSAALDKSSSSYIQAAQAAEEAARAEMAAGQQAKASSMEQTVAMAAMAAAAQRAFSVIVSAIKSGTDAYNEYVAATKGLQSVSRGKGIDQGAMKQELDSVTDAFFDATAAAASYKNLLTRGYSLEQATQTIVRLKDAAAFGRQANLSLADAVKSATEGIKNENSVLVNGTKCHLPSRAARSAA